MLWVRDGEGVPRPCLSSLAQPVAQSLKAQLEDFLPRIAAEESSSGNATTKKIQELDVEESACTGESENFISLEEVDLAWDGDMKSFIELPPLEDLLTDCSQFEGEFAAYRDCRSSSGPLETNTLDQLYNLFTV